MPLFNGINTDVLEEFARRFLGIRQGGIMPSLSPEPSVAINYPTAPDQLALAGYIPWGASGVVAAGGAGTETFVCVRNVSSNLIVVCIFACSSTAGLGGLRLYTKNDSGPVGGAALPAAQAGWLDMRRVNAGFPLGSVVAIESGTVAALPPASFVNSVADVRQPQDTQATFPAVVLPPNSAAAVAHLSANVALSWSVSGFMRDALPDELTGI